MIKKIIFIVFMILGFVATAQIPKEEITTDVSIFPTEKIHLSVNSNMLLAGELLQYKGYILDAADKESKLSKIVYVSLRDENDSIVFNHKLKVENGSANGDFFVPSSLITGIYRLVAYTNFSRNNVENAFTQKNIYIINTFLKPEKNIEYSTDTLVFESAKNFSTSKTLNPESSKNLINTAKSKYGYREKVAVTVENPFPNNLGNYVLSVRKVNPLEIPKIPSKEFKNKISETFYLPEIRGEVISGMVLSSSDNSPISGKEVSLTISGNDYIFKIATTNSNGRFFFSIAEEFNAEKSIIQLNESPENVSEYKLILDKKAFELGKSNHPSIKLSPSLKEWLEERSVQLQIENAYFDVKKDSILKKKESEKFFENLGTVFLLDDYTRFPTVRETFIEVVTLAAIRGSEPNARFIVKNEYDPNGTAKFNDIDPLVLMDGMQIQNNHDLLNYNSREIESIRVIIQPYRYGPSLFSGVIAVETKKGDFIPSPTADYIEEFNFPSLVKRKQNYQPDYSDNAPLARIPDYRVQLFWNPKIEFKDGKYSTEFFTSDVPGLYEMTIEGYSAEGEFISEKSYFTVAEK